MSAVAPLTDHYLDSFGGLQTGLPGSGLDWLQEIRERGIARFGEIGFPSTREEQWKYTDVRPLLKHRFASAAPSDAAFDIDVLGDAWLPALDCYRMTFVDGHFSPSLSDLSGLPRGARAQPLPAALAQMPELVHAHLARHADAGASGFAALNDAFMQDGACLHLAPGVALDKPLHLVFVATAHDEPVWHHLRNLVVAGSDSEAVLVESYIHAADSVYLTNAVSELVLEDGARLQHYKLQRESQQGYHIATLQFGLSRDSNLVSHVVSSGARLARNDLNVGLDAEGAECSLYGLYVTGGRQHTDNHTRVDHRRPHGTSREFYKGVLGGRGRAVFNGQVFVHPHAQKTNAEQSNKNLLLSADAEVDTKPQLEIYADDVKCGHGATVGQLDENMLYYLQARGIEESRARAMLTYGFAHDVIEKMALTPVRESIEHLLMTQLPDTEHLGGPT